MFLCDPPVFNNKRVMAQRKFYTPLPTLPSKTDITRFDGMVCTKKESEGQQSLENFFRHWYSEMSIGTVPRMFENFNVPHLVSKMLY